MAIICDTCSADVTPGKDYCSDMKAYETIDLNGKLCLCHDCYIALSEFVLTDDFKKVVKKYKAQFEVEED